VASAPSPFGVAVSPDGRSVYVTNLAGGSVSQYGVGPGGTLAPLPAPTVPTPADGQPWDIAVSPDSRRVYVSHGSASALSQFHVGVGGALTPMAPATAPSTNAARGIAVPPRAAPVAAASAGASGLLAAFDGSASSSRDGSVARYDWDFGRHLPGHPDRDRRDRLFDCGRFHRPDRVVRRRVAACASRSRPPWPGARRSRPAAGAGRSSARRAACAPARDRSRCACGAPGAPCCG
jgi:hypothetical protein